MRIRAEIEDEEGGSSVEFSLEEVIGRSPGIGWKELGEDERMHAIEDYALWLYSRQDGKGGTPRVNINRATLP